MLVTPRTQGNLERDLQVAARESAAARKRTESRGVRVIRRKEGIRPEGIPRTPGIDLEAPTTTGTGAPKYMEPKKTEIHPTKTS